MEQAKHGLEGLILLDADRASIVKDANLVEGLPMPLLKQIDVIV